jgi:hypothetical protein
MTDRMQGSVLLPAAIAEHLSEEDDAALWEQVLKTLAEDAAALEITGRSPLYAEAGRCSHWLRPIRRGGLPPAGLPIRSGMAMAKALRRA